MSDKSTYGSTNPRKELELLESIASPAGGTGRVPIVVWSQFGSKKHGYEQFLCLTLPRFVEEP